MANELAIPYSDIERMGTVIAKSGLFGIKTPEQAIALMLVAQAEGLHPAIAARDYHIIDGRPTLKADAMLARFQQSGGKIEWLKISETEMEARFIHPQGGAATIKWDLSMAKRAHLLGRKGEMWEKYPRQMLRARVVSEGIRTVFPSVVCGVYTPEEIMDIQPIVEAEPARKDSKIAKKSRAEEVKEALQKQEAPSPVNKAGCISQEQYDEIVSALKDRSEGLSPMEKKAIHREGLMLFGVRALSDIPAERYEAALAWARETVPVEHGDPA